MDQKSQKLVCTRGGPSNHHEKKVGNLIICKRRDLKKRMNDWLRSATQSQILLEDCALSQTIGHSLKAKEGRQN